MHPILFSDTLSIAGIIISALFGIWGIFLALRRVKYPASLTFVLEQSVALLDDFATKIPNLAVLYKNTPINKNVVLISGYLVNDGNVDITPAMTEMPLTCNLPGNCSWLEFKVTNTATALQVTSTLLSPTAVQIGLGLFRRDESFSFQALALLDDDHAKKKPVEFTGSLKWSHRIASLGTVKTMQMPEPETKTKRQRLMRKAVMILFAGFYMFFGFSQVTGFGPLGSSLSIAYEFNNGGNKSLLRLTPNRNGTTTVINVETQEESAVNLAEFSKTGTFVPIRTERREQDKMRVIMGMVTIILGASFLFLAFARDYKRYRTRRLVAASCKKI